jgi:hypothetical protein
MLFSAAAITIAEQPVSAWFVADTTTTDINVALCASIGCASIDVLRRFISVASFYSTESSLPVLQG